VNDGGMSENKTHSERDGKGEMKGEVGKRDWKNKQIPRFDPGISKTNFKFQPNSDRKIKPNQPQNWTKFPKLRQNTQKWTKKCISETQIS